MTFLIVCRHTVILYYTVSGMSTPFLPFLHTFVILGYFSHPCQSSGNHAPKCLHFSILCAKSVIIHTSVTYKLIKTGMSVNCNYFGVPVQILLNYYILGNFSHPHQQSYITPNYQNPQIPHCQLFSLSSQIMLQFT